MRRLALVLVSLVTLAGCANVSQWERSYLSDHMMVFDSDPIEGRLHRMIQDSREASTGGYGVSGGGCACSQ